MTKNSKGIHWICLGLSLFFCGIATASGIPKYGVFVYSNFCISEMSGDLAGNRITLLRTFEGDKIIYEYDDGQTNAVVAKKVSIDKKSRTIEFVLNDGGDVTSIISGEFSKDDKSLIVNKTLYGNTASTLIRISNFSAPTPYCK